MVEKKNMVQGWANFINKKCEHFNISVKLLKSAIASQIHSIQQDLDIVILDSMIFMMNPILIFYSHSF